MRERGQQRGGHTRRPRLRQVGGQGAGTLEAGARGEDEEGGRQGEGQQPHGHNSLTILNPVLRTLVLQYCGCAEVRRLYTGVTSARPGQGTEAGLWSCG